MKWISIISMLFLFSACQTTQHKYTHEEIENYTYKTPIQLADGWASRSLIPSVRILGTASVIIMV